ncbi:EAL domain-containing protein [Vibrio barjaei]|uniref:EAL domain-containing protein n=1 Tax=Vibrio barjaei TaxID=1676683 RepID=A0ABW7IF33_9VIBR
MNRNQLILPLLLTLSVISAGSYWVYTFVNHAQQEKMLHAQEIAFDKARAIELELAQALSVTRVLALLISQDQDNVEDFEFYAQGLLAQHPLVDNIQLAPDGIVQHIYPLKGHEAAIGHNLLQDPARKVDALRAISAQKLTLSGPFQLKQGGVAVIGRLPVFSPQQKAFWGFASALIYFDNVLLNAGLPSSADSYYSFNLSATDITTGQVKIIAGIKQPLSDSQSVTTTSTITLPNQQWQLAITLPTSRWEKFFPLVSYFVIISVGVCSGWITWKYLQLPIQLQQAVKKKTRQLENLSFTDSVTGIGNRRFFMKKLVAAQTHTQTTATKAVLFIDLNDFKIVNDRHGHLFGDKVLKLVSQRLKVCAAHSDITARVGGDEFGQLLLDIKSRQHLQDYIGNVITSLKEPMSISGIQVTVSASVGVALTPEHGHRATELLKAADIAMYHAKKKNSGFQCCFYDPSMAQKFRQIPNFKRDFTEALSHEQLRLYYQPIYCLRSQHIVHYEALVRWQHPQKGLLPPSEFLELAEQVNLLVELEQWVLNKACADIARHREIHAQEVCIAINMSPDFLTNSDLLQQIDNALARYELPTNAIKLELTETSVLSHHDSAMTTLTALREKGIEVALDDFGTGYSSFSLLHELPIHTLKLDKSFIDKILIDSKDYCVVASIIELAHKLNLNVIAEGIESKEQQDKLTSLDCDYGQGYYFSPPHPLFDNELHASNCDQYGFCNKPCIPSHHPEQPTAPIPISSVFNKANRN